MGFARSLMKMACHQSTQGFSTSKIIPSRRGNLAVLELNNPLALNALDLKMVRAINAMLSTWHTDESLKGTLVIGKAGKTKKGCRRPIFCAGGDVKSVYHAGIKPIQVNSDPEVIKSSEMRLMHGYGVPNLLTSDFFREEYRMNYTIASQIPTCPQISVWDGIVMGGGVGISVHGKYRVATENTVFAMPETGIGLFPDVGGMHFLPRLEGGIGTYLALSGKKLQLDDLLYSGIATHYVPAIKLEQLQSELARATAIKVLKDDAVVDTLSLFDEKGKVDPFASHLAVNREAIDYAFEDKQCVEDIVAALKRIATWARNSEFGSETLSNLQRMSPTSLKVTLEGMKRGAKMDIGEDLEMEYRMVQGFMREGSDFYEGIRALLVDKDNSPRWDPASIEAVTTEYVESFFEDLGENELRLTRETSSKL